MHTLPGPRGPGHGSVSIKDERGTNLSLIHIYSGADIKTIEKDADRDYWLTAQEAVEYGLVDKMCIRDSPKRFKVNLYRKILLPAHTKTLVKVVESPDNTEPFNCFYYSDIITFHGICQVYPKGDWDWRHKNIWSYEHWYYTRTGQWTAEYVMTVDHDIWNDW